MDALNVPCPICDARVGQFCTDAPGSEECLLVSHWLRMVAAAEARADA